MNAKPAFSNVPSLLFVLALAGNAAWLGWPAPVAWKLPFVVVQGLLLVGALEAVHQATHENLFSARLANKWVGTALGLVLLLNFVRYRFFHAHHHAHTATARDPEKALYQAGGGNGLLAWLTAPWGYLQFAAVVLRSRYVGPRMQRAAAINSALLGAFVLAALALTLWQPVPMLLAYWLPLALYAWFDHLLNQAEHYGMQELPDGADASGSTNDLLLPQTLGLIFLYRNFHRVHHLRPKTPWYRSAHEYRQLDHAGLSWAEFFRNYMRHGTRLWGVR